MVRGKGPTMLRIERLERYAQHSTQVLIHRPCQRQLGSRVVEALKLAGKLGIEPDDQMRGVRPQRGGIESVAAGKRVGL